MHKCLGIWTSGFYKVRASPDQRSKLAGYSMLNNCFVHGYSIVLSLLRQAEASGSVDNSAPLAHRLASRIYKE